MNEKQTLLPVTLQVLKDKFDQAPSGSCVPDPEYDFDAEMTLLLAEGLNAEDILVVRCPSCGQMTYYNGGFTANCSCCGYYNLADLSNEAVTLADWWDSLLANDVLW
jgi:hypothetical protein